MTRRELVERVREGLEGELSDGQVAAVIERAIGEIGAAIQRDGRVTLPGFGTFTVRVTAARIGRPWGLRRSREVSTTRPGTWKAH